MARRGLSPVVGVVCLVGITVVLASVLGLAVPMTGASDPTLASFDATVEPSGELHITHQAGESIDPETLDLTIRVEGEPLKAQPPVPFFSAHGFESGPSGAFNSATTDSWSAGETASLQIAGTNAPAIEAGDTVRIHLSSDGQRVATLEATA